MKKFKNPRLADPFLQPQWRQDRVLRMLRTSPPERCRRFDDDWIRQYRTFMLKWGKGETGREALLYENPGMYYAQKIFDSKEEDPELHLIIEARLLAGESYAAIAETCKTYPEAIQWYEKLFFNVNDFLDNRDWILKQVLLPASDREAEHADSDTGVAMLIAPKRVQAIVKPHFDMTLKFFAYYGGPIVCDLLISGFRRDRIVTSTKELEEYFNEQFMTQIAIRSAQAASRFEVNKFNVMELFATHSRLVEIQRNAGNKNERHNEFEKHVDAMLSELPWAVGDDGAKLYAQTAVGEYDEMAAEINEEEMICAEAGMPADTLEGIATLTITSREEFKENAKAK